MTSAGNTYAMSSGGPGFAATLASEWTKVRALRSTYIMMVLSVVLSIGLTALISLAFGSSFDDLSAQQQADFEPVSFSFIGMLISGIIFIVFGALFVTSEYSSGMIRLTLTVTPRRGRVWFAKVLIVTAVTLVVGAVIALGCFLAAQAVFASYDLPTASLGDPDVQRAMIAVILTGPLFPIIAASLGILLRSTAGTITIALALVFLPAMFGGLLPEWWQENILSLLPGNASDSLALSHLQDSAMYLGVGPALVVLAAWLVIFIGGAYYVLNKRDA